MENLCNTVTSRVSANSEFSLSYILKENTQTDINLELKRVGGKLKKKRK